MPAHKIPLIKSVCRQEGCGKTSEFLVRTMRNEAVGEFCRKHADERLEALNGPPPPKAKPPNLRKRAKPAEAAA